MDRLVQPGHMIRDMAHQQLPRRIASEGFVEGHLEPEAPVAGHEPGGHGERPSHRRQRRAAEPAPLPPRAHDVAEQFLGLGMARSEEHTSELQSLMRISYAVFCLKKKKTNQR